MSVETPLLECPVCYELLEERTRPRTLVCGHTFCHDCLASTLLRGANYSAPKKSLTCPVCRHLTIILKQSKDDAAEDRQTLELPATSRACPQSNVLQSAWDPTWLPRRLIQPLTVDHSKAPQVFIISNQEHPMGEENQGTLVDSTRGRRTVNAPPLIIFLALLLLASAASVLRWLLM